ncbi:MAG: hypothetical protein UX85_C0001G0173 [Candidatus Beckwithbacteria bacterium GW2011_GWB1_47_15]|uniref:Secondary thiamine-phosphate synthase enzyme n=1 Tax=Candidatus Beckwithbacteria bacterium GW2011_GWB1_47_15 TaxID=1618371 RepID=A0A0G1RXA2_9BACT|nr:MAG: hypothetical protein UY43_C0001G0953 [Candidatus Beckwithbacteria bacterium GW2011_GWC1_49_16]AQS30810.1 hypothetical protein [uncultured bacterium]KKU35995.1 MAG: hypothetical protein UX50_C0001G0172 [Candidatus Beckwithbacteria bacterium GW2011_GWA1_46_30]KKU61959.1 MAG: hypothetical protein UX85_C0001G0173 [Candidatus Beckwithbacteria bacterium GW2011_GWB1_47_15]KKU72487.1 MAG: hypothetical protein UX97_C0001G0357 [Candidatus Beckwithbacteria bacterium GW2011_GWA2_47_25]KKW04346.1 M
MTTVTIASDKKDQVVDISDRVQEVVDKAGVKDGSVTVSVAHTTCAVTTADLDPGTDEDMMEAFRAMVPKLKFRHPHDPEHAPDHILSSLIGPSVTVPVAKGKLVLGSWQRIVLVEFNGPRQRHITIYHIPGV